MKLVSPKSGQVQGPASLPVATVKGLITKHSLLLMGLVMVSERLILCTSRLWPDSR